MRRFGPASLLLVAALARASTAFAAETPAPPASEPPAAAAAFAEGKMAAMQGAFDDACAAFDRALALSAKGPDAAYILIEKAEALARRGQASRDRGKKITSLTSAASTLSAAAELAGDNLDVLRAVGAVQLALADAGDSAAPAKALAAYQAVLARDPTDAEVALSLGNIYLAQRQPSQAADVLRQLLDKVPRQRVAYGMLVEALLRAGRLKEAEGTLAEMLAFDPASLEARLTLADLQLQRGDPKAAQATLLAAPKETQDDPRLRQALARILDKNPG